MDALGPARKTAWWGTVRAVVRQSAKLKDVPDADLREQLLQLRWRAKTGEKAEKLLVETFALVREASRRTLGMTPYPVQILGGIGIVKGRVVQMQTGEGKTLTAGPPAVLRALPGKGSHVVTANDYLASRDEETLRPVFEFLGLTSGCVVADMEDDDRRAAYAKDVTYGTAKEFGFDFLRDRLKKGADGHTIERAGFFAAGGFDDGDDPLGGGGLPGGGSDNRPVQRGHHFALVDEADSLLIDEARTPLIIGLTRPNDPATVSLYRWSAYAARQLARDEDYLYEPEHRMAQLTRQGCRSVLLAAKPSLVDTVDSERVYVAVEKALTADLGFARDRDYVVAGDKVAIVDESTGRVMEGRKWQDGLHQAVEAKERVPVTAATGQAARITLQAFFREYAHLAGMTGTAVTARRELNKNYRTPVTVIPTNKPCIRRGLRTRVYRTLSAKRRAVCDEIEAMREARRPTLVGTPSVAASDALSAELFARGVPHAVINAREHEREADVVAVAGKPGAVTIATNMAGRGTDIHLDPESVKAGGLHVVATEMHSSARIDRQLVGRAARQGDPGSFRFFLSLEDELLRCYSPRRRKRLLDASRGQPDARGELPRRWVRVFRAAQSFLEKMHRRQRRDMLKGEKERDDLHRKAGLDPCLELTE